MLSGEGLEEMGRNIHRGKWEGRGRDVTEGFQGAGMRGPDDWAKDPRGLENHH